MKYVIIRCEDYARIGQQVSSLLEGAKTAHLQHLAQAGAAGLVRQLNTHPTIDRFALHRAAFELGPEETGTTPAECYAASVNLKLAEGETAWCCDFVTQQDGTVIDPTAGNIPTKESEALLDALNQQFGSETRRWRLGSGSHHLLIARDPALDQEGRAPFCSPELLVGQLWKRHLPKRAAAGEALQRIIEQASAFLEDHPVNRVRVDLGENPANLMWLWGVSTQDTQKTFKERTGRSGVVISSSFPMKGFAAALGVEWREGPASLEEAPLQRLVKALHPAINSHDVVYVHLRVQSADPVERLCAMERIDQILLKSLTEMLPSQGPWRLAMLIDDRVNHSVPWVAIGSGLPQQPVAALTAQHLAMSPLAFADGPALFSWFMKDV